MDVSTAQADLSSVLAVRADEGTRQIAEQERLRNIEMRQQDDVVTASRSPEQATGQFVDEVV
ncbi:hypothetical protein SAMN05660653_02523 [Desulfonatronum thiosulfatophilum]|uniref:Uncharacterized protein n=1 Tax=Desulfonatronum thiosulfatophilum TaxID=617002 RepID=A0A1G6E1I6_9BACT|nr:hypothetical protein [Desulfonatronum thiosulfatophilum]SDB51246.1 hypothetical protein SAMN05660653_02523 [Desulfonatronum thiosulfatophilum]